MDSLREEIQKIIEQYKDPQEAGINVCIYLESILDLNGNGWFDDDEIMLNILGSDTEVDDNND